MLSLWFSLGDSIRADYLFSLFIIFPNVYDHALPHRTCGICFLTRASSVKVLSPNHWTTWELLIIPILKLKKIKAEVACPRPHVHSVVNLGFKPTSIWLQNFCLFHSAK